MKEPAILGKLPAHGDFVARGLGAGERGALDDWLAASLGAAQARLGDRFGEAFDAAPPWRFAARDGEGWVAGAIAPSIDAAGRRYPVMAMRGANEHHVAMTALHCERAIYDALAQGWTADALHAGVAAPPTARVHEEDEWNGGEGFWSLGGSGLAPARLPGARPVELMAAMLTMREIG